MNQLTIYWLTEWLTDWPTDLMTSDWSYIKGVVMQNLYFESEFDLSENEVVVKEHFHMNGDPFWHKGKVNLEMTFSIALFDVFQCL